MLVVEPDRRDESGGAAKAVGLPEGDASVQEHLRNFLVQACKFGTIVRNREGELADGVTLDEQVCVMAHTVEQDFVTFLHELADFFTEGIGFGFGNAPDRGNDGN